MDSRPEPATHSYTGVRALVAAAVVGSMLLAPTFGPNIAAVDVVLAVAIAVACTGGPRSPARRLLLACVPAFWLILLGSMMGLFGVGLTTWAIDTLVRDAFSFAIFFAVFELARRSRRVTATGLVAVAVAVSVLALIILATGSTYRPAGTFANPNYAGHFLALGAALTFLTSRAPTFVRIGMVGVVGLAVASTGSFGSASMLLAGASYFMYSRVRYDRRFGVRLAFALLLLVLAGTMWKAFNAADSSEFALGPSINSYRLQNTTNVREGLWRGALELVPRHPLGVGPYGIKTRELLGRDVEVHNELLAYLVERSVVGLAGLLALFTVLWRRARQGGVARLLIVMFMVGGVFRETLHFRHAWIFLGLAFAYDTLNASEHAEADAPLTTVR